ncbi:MAG: hypothetical protein E4H28_06365, partial [Gemmatimonadales bacterium]
TIPSGPHDRARRGPTLLSGSRDSGSGHHLGCEFLGRQGTSAAVQPPCSQRSTLRTRRRRPGALRATKRAAQGVYPERLAVVTALGVVGNAMYQFLFITGIDGTLAGNAALILAMSPVFVTLLSALLGQEKVRATGWAGVAVSTIGIGLVVWGGSAVRFGSVTLRGDLTILAASVAWSMYTVGASPLVRRHGALPVTAATMWIGAVVLFLVAIPSMAAQDWTGPTLLAWTGLVASGLLAVGLSYVLWYYGVEHLGNSRTAVFSNTVPIVALLFAWLALGETPVLMQVTGAVLILGGVTLTRMGGTGTPGIRARPAPIPIE